MSKVNLGVTVRIDRYSLRIDDKTRHMGKLTVTVEEKTAVKTTNIMVVTLEELVQATQLLNEIAKKYYQEPENTALPEESTSE